MVGVEGHTRVRSRFHIWSRNSRRQDQLMSDVHRRQMQQIPAVPDATGAEQ